MSEIDYFMPLLMQKEEESALTPVLSRGKVHFLWIKHSNLYRILSVPVLMECGLLQPLQNVSLLVVRRGLFT